MTRVLFLTESFHPVLGGGEQHIRALASRLAAEGMATTIVTRRTDASWPEEETVDGVRVVRVAPSGHGRTGKYRMVPGAVAALLRERDRYDVVVVRGTRVLGLPGLLAARLLGKAVVLQAEVNGEMSGEVYTWGTALARPPWRELTGGAVAARNALLRDADAFVAMSRLIRDEFLAAGVPEERVAWIPHGVDLDRFRPPAPGEREELRGRLRLPQHAVLITYTGRLLRGKGLETLLDAFVSLSAPYPGSHLVLVGSGAGQALGIDEELRSRAEAGSLAGRVTLTGRVDDVEDYLKASDVFVFPSTFEALGLSLLEASACGLPCVGSRTGGIVDVIEDGRSGSLVTPGRAGDLAAALAELVASPSRRAAQGARGRQIAEARFDFGANVGRYRALFQEVSPRSSACSKERAPRAGAAPRRSPAPRA